MAVGKGIRRSVTRRPKRGPEAAGYERLQIEDLVYQGAIKVESTPNGVDPRYLRSLTFRELQSDAVPKHLISAGANAGTWPYGVVEFRVGTPQIRHTIPDFDPRNYPAAAGVKDYQHLTYTTAGGANLTQGNELSGCSGVEWDHWDVSLIWAQSQGYQNFGKFGKCTLDYANAMAVSSGPFQCIDPRWKGTSAGAVVAPTQGFADKFFGGRLRGMCASTGESIVAVGDQSFGPGISLLEEIPDGFGIYPQDMATAGADATTVTSATGGFTTDMIGSYLAVHPFNGPWFEAGYYLITGVPNANTLELATSPTPDNPGTGGMGFVMPWLSATHAIGCWPYADTQTAGLNRMPRPEPSFSGGNRPDAWTVNDISWGDHHRKGTLVDVVVDRGGVPTRVVAFVVPFDYFRGYEQYLNSQIVGSYPGMGFALYDPAGLATAEGSTNTRHDPEPYAITPPGWLFPVCDPADYTRPAGAAVTSVASDSAKTLQSYSGCVVTQPGHGLAAGVALEITGAPTSTHNGLWHVVGVEKGNVSASGTTVTFNDPPGVLFNSTVVDLKLVVASGTNFVPGTYAITGAPTGNTLTLATDPTNGSPASGGVATVSGVIDANSYYVWNTSSSTAWAGTTDDNAGIEHRPLKVAPDTPFGAAADNDPADPAVWFGVVKGWGITGLDTRPLFQKFAIT